MIMLGVVLLVIGFVAHIPIVWSIGGIVLVIGMILWLLQPILENPQSRSSEFPG